ncbi:MAG: single-stranded-DNA-specific exonuclease RecJ [Candidatus Omnitrophica bacterium]|nr:single-stranded-DNA-specific exonuclease RecJ [Candidatus Omnitrophota bacterium]
MRTEWLLADLNPDAVELGEVYGLNPLIVHLLLARGIPQKEFLSFLNPSLGDLYSPHRLPDMEKALGRIRSAIEKKEDILLFGDYDVDGITSVIILNEYLKTTPCKVHFYIPHRVEEGYGLNTAAIDEARRKNCPLLIAVDCGTNSYEEIEYARSFGIDVIVLDHHTPKKGLNTPYAFINPKREESDYPFGELSSGGIVFKFVQALSGRDCFELLDLVALSVVCDVAPLRGENRIFLVEGLKQLRDPQRLALKVLCETTKIKPANIQPYHLGYILGPRINACGRIASAKEVLDLFLSDEYDTVREVAQKMNEYNTARRSIESAIYKEAELLVEKEYKDDTVLVLSKEGWHQGVLGIVASRLADKYSRPAFLIGCDEKKGKGSARSVAGVHIMDALGECQDYLATYGGHKKAAGIEILEENIEAFRVKINAVVKDTFSQKQPATRLTVDVQLDFKDITLGFVDDIERLSPFGEENRAPLFLSKGILPKTSPQKLRYTMYSVWLTDGSCTYEAIFYERNGFFDLINYGKPLDVVYSLERNYYHNSVRLVLKDVRLA